MDHIYDAMNDRILDPDCIISLAISTSLWRGETNLRLPERLFFWLSPSS